MPQEQLDRYADQSLTVATDRTLAGLYRRCCRSWRRQPPAADDLHRARGEPGAIESPERRERSGRKRHRHRSTADARLCRPAASAQRPRQRGGVEQPGPRRAGARCPGTKLGSHGVVGAGAGQARGLLPARGWPRRPVECRVEECLPEAWPSVRVGDRVRVTGSHAQCPGRPRPARQAGEELDQPGAEVRTAMVVVRRWRTAQPEGQRPRARWWIGDHLLQLRGRVSSRYSGLHEPAQLEGRRDLPARSAVRPADKEGQLRPAGSPARGPASFARMEGGHQPPGEVRFAGIVRVEAERPAAKRGGRRAVIGALAEQAEDARGDDHAAGDEQGAAAEDGEGGEDVVDGSEERIHGVSSFQGSVGGGPSVGMAGVDGAWAPPFRAWVAGRGAGRSAPPRRRSRSGDGARW